MIWNRLFIMCCSSLVLFSFAGCKRVIKVNVDPKSLSPLMGTSVPGDTLEWAAIAPDESFDIIPDEHVCTQKGRLHASYGHPAKCIVAPQDFKNGKTPIIYTYTIESNEGGIPRHNEFRVAIGPGHCPYC